MTRVLVLNKKSMLSIIDTNDVPEVKHRLCCDLIRHIGMQKRESFNGLALENLGQLLSERAEHVGHAAVAIHV